MPDKDVEEILELIWMINESGDAAKRDNVIKSSKVANTESHLKKMQSDNLITIVDGILILTEEGTLLGESVVRRQRLAECLLSNVFELDQPEWEHSACEFEHILSVGVTKSICTFLGHPPVCPHGKPVPKGDCCKTFSKDLKPLVLNASEMRPGEYGRVVFISPKHHDRLDKLSSLGLVPGAIVKLHQKQPTYVLDIGETSLAIDLDIAREIFVKKVESF